MLRSDRSGINPVFQTPTVVPMIKKKIEVGNDQEMAQSGRNPHSKNRGGKKLN